MGADKPNPGAIEKALDLMLAFAPKNYEMGTVQLSEKTGFHIATVNRTLKILAKKRFLQQHPETRKFTLGPAILALVESFLNSLHENLLPTALPHLNELRDKVRETVVMEVISGMSGIISYVAEGKKALNIRAAIGARTPTHAAAGAKAILAFSEKETIEKFLKKKMRRFTETTITDPKKLKTQLQKIRRDGVAFAREEIDEGINAIGAPILNHEGRPMAAVVLVGPSSRVKCDVNSSLVHEVKRTASQIAANLFPGD